MGIDSSEARLSTAPQATATHAFDEVNAAWTTKLREPSYYDPLHAFVLGTVGSVVYATPDAVEGAARSGVEAMRIGDSFKSLGALKGFGTGVAVAGAESLLDHNYYRGRPAGNWTMEADLIGGIGLFAAPGNLAIKALGAVALHEAARFAESKGWCKHISQS